MYRLGYNVLAVGLLLPPLWLLYHGAAVPLWEWRGVGYWLTQALALAAVIGFVVSTRYYDGQAFLGLRQLKAGATQVEDQEHLRLSPLHRYVRHPWYSMALVLIWTRPMDSLMLVTAILLSGYFYLGSRLEEHKLLGYYGVTYRKYRAMVPPLIPLPWKYLKPGHRRCTAL